MLIGTISTGKICEFDSQSIKTKFIIIGLPIIPIGTYYSITDNIGIPIHTNWKSIWYGYSRTTLFAIGFFLMFIRLLGEYSDSANLLTALGAILFINGFYNWSLNGKIDPKEEEIRSILSKSFDYNMLPEYLPLETRLILLKELLLKYCTQFEKADWESEIMTNNINEHNENILFALSYYHLSVVNDNQNYQLLFSTMDNHLKNKKRWKQVHTN